MPGPDSRLFPIFVDVGGRPCVVVGEGPVAEKRARQLLKYGAEIIVFSAVPGQWFLRAEADGKLTIERRRYLRGDLYGAFLAICATDDAQLRDEFRSEAESTGCFALIDGDAASSSFILPSITHRDPIQIAVSTAGTAPELAKMLRKRIEGEVSESWGPWARMVVDVRGRAMATVEDESERARILAAVTDPSILERLDAGEEISIDEFFAPAEDDSEGVAEDGSSAAVDAQEGSGS